MVVELQEVVRRRDQSPFASAGGSASALEAFDRAVELDLAEDRLDGDLALTSLIQEHGARTAQFKNASHWLRRIHEEHLDTEIVRAVANREQRSQTRRIDEG